MNRSVYLLVSLLLALFALSACSGVPQQAQVALLEHEFKSVTLLPVQFSTNQPDSFCHPDIGSDLQNILAQSLKRKGYAVSVIPTPLSRSFKADPPPPPQGTEFTGQASTETVLGPWVEYYLATTLCESDEPAQLHMGVVAVLYTLPDGREIGRWKASVSDMGGNSSSTTVWSVSTRIADKLLAAFPDQPL